MSHPLINNKRTITVHTCDHARLLPVVCSDILRPTNLDSCGVVDGVLHVYEEKSSEQVSKGQYLTLETLEEHGAVIHYTYGNLRDSETSLHGLLEMRRRDKKLLAFHCVKPGKRLADDRLAVLRWIEDAGGLALVVRVNDDWSFRRAYFLNRAILPGSLDRLVYHWIYGTWI